MTSYRTMLAAACLALAPLSASAHPHVIVDAKSAIVFDEKGEVTGVRHTWTFDAAFSAFAIQGLDENGDGIYTREELTELAEVNVTSLKDFDFFTWMTVAETNLEFAEPTDYWLDHETDALTLNFTLPLKQSIAANATEVILDVYDPQYYVAFSLKPDSVTMAGAPSRCSVTVDAPPKLDDATAAILRLIPADQRELPENLKAYTGELSNTARLKCT